MLGSAVVQIRVPCAKKCKTKTREAGCSRSSLSSRSSSKRFATEMIIRRWGGRKWLGGDRGKSNGGGSSKQNDSDGEGSNGLQSPSRQGDEPIENQDWRRYRAKLVASEGCYEGCFVPDADNNDSQVWAHTVSAIEPGCILLAKPTLEGWFTRTVVLVLDHDKQSGSLGVTLNRLTSLSLEDVGGVNMDSSLQHQLKMQRLYVGGPVASNTILSLSNQSVDGSVDIVDGVYCGGLKDACTKLQRGDLDPDDLRLYMGYCGWSPHQLEQEVDKGYWWIVSASNDILQMHEHAQGAHASSLWNYLYHLLKFAPQDNQ